MCYVLTVFMILNNRKNEEEERLEIKVVQETIKESEHTKLLGVEIQESQNWNVHIQNLKNALNFRLFQIRRIANQIPKDKLMRVVHSIWMSKLRYGLQLCAVTQEKEGESKNTEMKAIQVTQNRLLRMITGNSIRDRKSTKELLETTKLPSVNQLAVEIRMTEAWKSMNDPTYPIQLERIPHDGGDNNRTLRPSSLKEVKDSARTKIGENSFCMSAARMWNSAPAEIKQCSTLTLAKKRIKEFCKTMPI